MSKKGKGPGGGRPGGGGRVTPKLKPQERKCQRRSMAYGRDVPHLMTTLTTSDGDGNVVRTEEVCNWCGSGWSR